MDYEIANIFVYVYGSADFYLAFSYADRITFPTTTLINQFLLPKSQTFEFDFYMNGEGESFSLISKNSLRNIGISVTLEKEDITFKDGGYLYPNGYSYIFDSSKYTTPGNCQIKIENNKKNARDEVIIFGYTYSGNLENIFPNSVVNGYQLYLEKVENTMGYLSSKLNKIFYYSYQLYGKNVNFKYLDSNNVQKGENKIKEYNSMVCTQKETEKLAFYLSKMDEQNLAINIQFLDFTDLEIVQKNLQPLVTGLPKSILIPAGKSLYHFLPPVEDAKEIHYYIRSKIQNSKMYVAFKTCDKFPNNCYITEKLSSDTSIPLTFLVSYK